MPTYRPLVIVSGIRQEIPVGDLLPSNVIPAGGGWALDEVEANLGEYQESGFFFITGLTGLEPGAPVMVVQSAVPYTGKGSVDEAEVDVISARGYVYDEFTIKVFWSCTSGRVSGYFKFGYIVSGPSSTSRTYDTLDASKTYSGNFTYSNGDLTVAITGSPDSNTRTLTSKTSGLWYFEITADAIGGDSLYGMCRSDVTDNCYPGTALTNSIGVYHVNNAVESGLTNPFTSYPIGVALVSGDIIGILADLDSGNALFYKKIAGVTTLLTTVPLPNWTPGSAWMPCIGSAGGGVPQTFTLNTGGTAMDMNVALTNNANPGWYY